MTAFDQCPSSDFHPLIPEKRFRTELKASLEMFFLSSIYHSIRNRGKECLRGKILESSLGAGGGDCETRVEVAPGDMV